MMKNVTKCRKNSRSDYQLYLEVCSKKLDTEKKMDGNHENFMKNPVNQAIVTSMICGVFIISMIASVMAFKWYLKHSHKKKVLRQWKMAFPATTVYKYVQYASG